MKLEDQVCGLELAKKLNELGVRQESLFWWTDIRGRSPEYREAVIHGRSPHPLDKIICSAFTVTELGEMLPPLCEIKRTRANNWRLEYVSSLYVKEGNIHFDRANFREKTEADARSRMLIYLIEEGLLDAKEIK